MNTVQYGYRIEHVHCAVQNGCKTGQMNTGRMQDTTDAGQDTCRIGQMQDSLDRTVTGQDGCRTGRMQDRSDVGHV